MYPVGGQKRRVRRKSVGRINSVRVLVTNRARFDEKQKGVFGVTTGNPLISLVGRVRIELTTNGLKVRCSTSELTARVCHVQKACPHKTSAFACQAESGQSLKGLLRMMVFSLPAPTETSVSGTPDSVSIRSTYRRAFFGRSPICLAWRMSSVHPSSS